MDGPPDPPSPCGRGSGEGPRPALDDPLPLAQALIRCASITPADAGAQTVLANALEELGFRVTPLRYGEIDNLFARIGTGSPHICFAGHTDVVPVGAANWQSDPFGGDVRDGVLYGRGACDMKGAIAAFVAAASQHLAEGYAAWLDQPADHRRRRRPSSGWHGARAGVDAGQRSDPRLLHCRRTHLPGDAGRHGEDRPAWQPECQNHRARQPGPRRLSAARRQPCSPAGPHRRCTDRSSAGRRQCVVSAIQPAVHQYRRRQSGDQRDPGRGQRDAEHPLQQRSHRGGAVRLAARSDRPACRTLRP